MPSASMARRGDPRDKRAGQMDSVLLRVPPDLDEAIYELAVASKLPAGFVVALAIGLLLRLLRREAAAP